MAGLRRGNLDGQNDPLSQKRRILPSRKFPDEGLALRGGWMNVLIRPHSRCSPW